MSYLVFARKFRPRTFSEVTGQEHVVRTLANGIKAGRIAHAFLFAGARGVGKTTIARILAKALNCIKGPTPEPCLECDPCREISEGRDMDVFEIDGASNRGIDQVNELRENVRYTPARDRFKVFIIDEVHMLTREAFNALLKTLEEPPPHVKFIFATTELHKIPATVLSRCQHHEFRRIPFRDIMARLGEIAAAEKVAIDEDALVLLARAADGSLRDGLSAFDQVVAFAGEGPTAADVATVLGLIDRDLVYTVADAVIAGDSSGLLSAVERLTDAGYNLPTFADELVEHFRNLVVAKAVAEPGELLALSDAERTRLAEQAASLGEDDAVRLLNLMGAAEQDLRHSNQPRFTLERILLRMAALRRLRPLEEVLAGLGGALPAAQPHSAARAVQAAPAPPPRPAAKPAPVAADKPPQPPPPQRAALEEPPAAMEPEAAVVATEVPATTADGPLGDRFVAAVKARKRSTGGFLDHAASIELRGKRLVVSFAAADAFYRSDISKDKAGAKILQEAAIEVAGPGVTVELAEAEGSAGQRQAEQLHDKLMEKVKKDVAVQDFLAVFDAKLLDVEES